MGRGLARGELGGAGWEGACWERGEGGEKLEKLGGLSLVGVVGGEERGVGRAVLRRIRFVTLRDWSGLVSMG